MSRRSLRRLAPSGLAVLAMVLGLAACGESATPAAREVLSTSTPTPSRCISPTPTGTGTASAPPNSTRSAWACPTSTTPSPSRTASRSASATPSGSFSAQPGIVPGPIKTEGAKNFHVTERIIPVGGKAVKTGPFGRTSSAAAKLHEIHIEQISEGGQQFIRVAWYFRDALPGSSVEYTDDISNQAGQSVDVQGDTKLNVQFQPATGRIAEPTSSPGQPVGVSPILQSLQQYDDTGSLIGFALGVQADTNGGPRPLRTGDFQQADQQFGTLFISFIDITA